MCHIDVGVWVILFHDIDITLRKYVCNYTNILDFIEFSLLIQILISQNKIILA